MLCWFRSLDSYHATNWAVFALPSIATNFNLVGVKPYHWSGGEAVLSMWGWTISKIWIVNFTRFRRDSHRVPSRVSRPVRSGRVRPDVDLRQDDGQREVPVEVHPAHQDIAVGQFSHWKLVMINNLTWRQLNPRPLLKIDGINLSIKL